jgi:hypothetical protein
MARPPNLVSDLQRTAKGHSPGVVTVAPLQALVLCERHEDSLRFARAFDEDRLAVARDAVEQIAQVNSRFCGGDAPHRPTSYQSIDR